MAWFDSDAARSISSFTHDPYPVWPTGVRYGDSLKPGTIADIPQARQWFKRIDEGRRAGLYSYALPLEGVSGTRVTCAGQQILSFSTYGYLSLNGHPRITAAAIRAVEKFGTNTGGARLLTGTASIHLEAEEAFAQWLGREDCAFFNCGYDANLAAISSLFGRGDIAILDSLAHRSLVDGCRLAGVEMSRFRHSDIDQLKDLVTSAARTARRVLIVVDGVYSMDGDQAPLPEIIEVKRNTGAFLLVDDSHALGVLGSMGQGTAHAQGVDATEIDITTSSLGKGFPSVGGLISGNREVITYLRHASAPFMFSSAASPANVAAARETIDILMSEPDHLQRLSINAARMRDLVFRVSGSEPNSTSPIVPLTLGNAQRAYLWARTALEEGVQVSPIPRPAVPAGKERLRLCATAGHEPEHFHKLEKVLKLCSDLEKDPAALRQRMSRFMR
jgi:8-amino-7-oxononanoate synthase